MKKYWYIEKKNEIFEENGKSEKYIFGKKEKAAFRDADGKKSKKISRKIRKFPGYPDRTSGVAGNRNP